VHASDHASADRPCAARAAKSKASRLRVSAALGRRKLCFGMVYSLSPSHDPAARSCCGGADWRKAGGTECAGRYTAEYFPLPWSVMPAVTRSPCTFVYCVRTDRTAWAHESVRRQPPNICAGAAPGLRRDCAGTGPHLRRDCAGAAPGLVHICAGTAPGLRHICAGTAPGLRHLPFGVRDDDVAARDEVLALLVARLPPARSAPARLAERAKRREHTTEGLIVRCGSVEQCNPCGAVRCGGPVLAH
jgi:hypothetical protein